MDYGHRSDGLNGLKVTWLDEFVSYKHSFSLLKTLIDKLELCGYLVDYCA